MGEGCHPPNTGGAGKVCRFTEILAIAIYTYTVYTNDMPNKLFDTKILVNLSNQDLRVLRAIRQRLVLGSLSEVVRMGIYAIWSNMYPDGMAYPDENGKSELATPPSGE